MPFALLFIGAVLLVAGLRDTYADLWALIKGDFTDKGGFLSWVAAIMVVGGLGYIPKLRALSIAFMTLLLIVLIISNSGVFAKLQAFIKGGAGANDPGNNIPNLRGSVNDVESIAESAGNLASIAANLAAVV